ncbi:MAG: hypothetical protein BGN87_00400 [Rhizobiales bacterium 65-79]|jgi:hypothetical protein|nr:DUF4153 domain-containing protein [Hyphomicrobiales bacterium]OJU02642.1 MAG: hypothetical protein BGN87_00400 [Rhizobiales bacterium 65-79]
MTDPSSAALGDTNLVGWRAVAVEMFEGACDAVMRFPVTAAALLALAINVNLLITDIKGFWAGDDDLILPLFAAASASLAASIVLEARHAAPAFRHGAALIAALAAFCIGWWDRFSAVETWSYVAALSGLMLVAPALGRRSPDAFWLFMVRFAFAVLVSVLALFLFAGGISAILASLTYLFGVEVPHRAYEHVWAATGLLAAPLFGLGRIPRKLDDEPGMDTRKFMALGMKALGDYVAAPLILVYAVVLHAYALKIVLTGDVPRGQIGWLVLAFGLSIFAALIIIHPFLRAARAPTRMFLRLWPFVLLVPLVLLAYALRLRVADYGLTPERYLLGLFGLVTAIVLLLQLPQRTRGDIRILAGLPTVALLLASFGPQGSVGASVRSQAARFERAVGAKPIDPARNGQALAALRFLEGHDAVGRVAPASVATVDANGRPKGASALYNEVADAYGLDRKAPYGPNSRYFSKTFSQPAAVPIGGYDTIVPNLHIFGKPSKETTLTLPGGKALSFALQGGYVDVTVGAETTTFKFDEAAFRELVDSQDAAPHPLELSDGRRTMLLVPEQAYGDLNPKFEPRSLTGTLLLRKAEWE